MKYLKSKKLLLTLVLIFCMQNGILTLPSTDNETYSDEELISPCNDIPSIDVPMD